MDTERNSYAPCPETASDDAGKVIWVKAQPEWAALRNDAKDRDATGDPGKHRNRLTGDG